MEITGGAPNADHTHCGVCRVYLPAKFGFCGAEHRAPRRSDVELTEQTGRQCGAAHPRMTARISEAVSPPMRLIPSVRPAPPTISS